METGNKKPGEGYVLAVVHNIQPDVSPENIYTVYEEAAKVNRYPLRI